MNQLCLGKITLFIIWHKLIGFAASTANYIAWSTFKVDWFSVRFKLILQH